MFEWLAPSFIYSVTKDLLGFVRGRRRRLSRPERLALRQQWKPQFEKRVRHTHQNGLREEVIIRDMRRIDTYPDFKKGKGLSSWFRLFLVGTYHRGILVAHSCGR
jgi:hypothetical protein